MKKDGLAVIETHPVQYRGPVYRALQRMEVKRNKIQKPFFSICIPQYNRTSFLIEACKSLDNQTLQDFEVCISDDSSTDGREKELLEFLEGTRISFTYRKQERNQRYDANLRAGIEMARGKYCFLLGNDDSLAHATTLEDLHTDLEKFEGVGVVITNYEDFSTGKEFRRIRRTEILGKGPSVAVNSFRNFSFLSGILLETSKAKRHTTLKWDGSEMVQMFIGCRIIAEGGFLLGIDRVTVRQGIQIPGERVDSYASRPRLNPCPIIQRRVHLDTLGRLVADAIAPYLDPVQTQRMLTKIFLQILLFTYPFWIFEYRRVQSLRYAMGVCLGMRPRNIFEGLRLGTFARLALSFCYGFISLIALLLPIRLFYVLYPTLYSIAKSVFLMRD